MDVVVEEDVQLKQTVAAILIGAAYRSLNEDSTSAELANQLIEGVVYYLPTDQMVVRGDLRMQIISLGLHAAPKRMIANRARLSSSEVEAIMRLTGRSYPIEVLQEIGWAVSECRIADRERRYFGFILVMNRQVFLAELPRVWGYHEWYLRLRPFRLPTDGRDPYLFFVRDVPPR